LVSSNPELTVESCTTIDEKIYPFSMNDISNRHGKNERNGWYLQQLLKLYAGLTIPGILDTYLVVDADTCFLKPTEFVKDDISLFNTGVEYHLPYFEHMSRFHPSLFKTHTRSGISHHMVFKTDYINELFLLVEKYHNGKLFWQVFLETVDLKNVTGSGASEYEIYFTFMLQHHADKMLIRPLTLIDCSTFSEKQPDTTDYICVHYYNRLN